MVGTYTYGTLLVSKILYRNHIIVNDQYYKITSHLKKTDITFRAHIFNA